MQWGVMKVLGNEIFKNTLLLVNVYRVCSSVLWRMCSGELQLSGFKYSFCHLLVWASDLGRLFCAFTSSSVSGDNNRTYATGLLNELIFACKELRTMPCTE